jgi:hypothetical protein
MLTATADCTWHVRPGSWRRYLALTLDGLRPAGPEPTALPDPALSPAEMRQAHEAATGLEQRGSTRTAPVAEL